MLLNNGSFVKKKTKDFRKSCLESKDLVSFKKNNFYIFFLIFFILGKTTAQVFIPISFWKSSGTFSVSPAGPIYLLAGDSIQLTVSGGMGVYNWTITGAASGDGAAITFSSPTDTVADYNARLTSYTTDIITTTSPGYANITTNVATYDAITISPTTATLGVSTTQSFSATGGCLNGANCVGGARVFSLVSGIGSINGASGLYTAPASTGSAVVQVADSIGNTATANITVSNNLTISPTTAKIAIYSTNIFSAILGTTPYTFSVNSGTGSVGCQSMLNGAHTNVVTTITVLSTAGCPSVGSIRVGTETICYTSTTGTTFTGAVRGCNATTAAAYATLTPYNSAQTVYTAPTMIGAATVRVTDMTLPTAGTSDAAVTIIKPVDVKVGQYFACALYDEGSVKCWGNNGNGQLGLGSTATIGDSGVEVGSANNFVNLGTGRTATKISVGLTHACAILDNATTKCWGNGGNGRLGKGNTSSLGDGANEMGDNLTAISLGTGRTATEIYALGAHTCALLDNSDLKCWGQNTYGQLGYQDTNSRGDTANEMGDNLLAVDLGTSRTATKVVGGLDFTCALLDNATVKCWGRNQRGQLGKDSIVNLGDGAAEMGNNLTAINIGAGRTALDIVALYESVCVRRDNNTMICWGRNNNGQIGIGSTGGANANIGDAGGEMAAIASINLAAGFGTLAKIYSNGRSACAEDTVNVVKCWGYNAYGQLLLGNATNQNSPSATAASFGAGLIVSKWSSSLDTTCVLFTNDRIKCFGRARTGTAGVVNGVLLNGSVESSLGDAAGELGNSLPYINH